jgi:uncharacterized protein (DUF1330 family)
MAAYVLVEVDVTDPEAYETYKTLAAAAVTTHGGRYIARGGATELLEGDVEPQRLVVLEFLDMDAARTWYHSPEYGEARAARAGAATGRFVIVDGLD